MRAWWLLFRVAARLLRAEPRGPDARALTEPNAFGLDASTWSGDDAEGIVHGRPQVVLPLLNSTTPAQKGKDVFVLGQFNTGTNLLEKLFMQNFHYAVKEHVRTVKVWKHLRPTELAGLGVAKDAVLLVCLRDPLSWLRSMRKAPYDLKNCLDSTPHGIRLYTMPKVELHGLADYWNRWMDEYEELPRQGF